MTKISNQYSLTNILTADLANSRLGINNVSPTVALDVTGAGKFSSSVTSDDLILTAGTLFGTGNTGFSNRLSDTTLYLQMPATGFNITDNALNTRFILSSAGIATFTGAKIQPNQTEIFASAGASNRAYAFSVGNVAAGDFTISQGSTATGGTYTTRLTINPSGNVGIGTSSPSAPLTVQKSAGDGNIATFTNGTTGINFNCTSTRISLENYDANQAFEIKTFGTGTINFYSSAIYERMRITSAGNVGIGTSAPGYKLEVSGTGYFSGNLSSGSSISAAGTLSSAALSTSQVLYAANLTTFNYTGSLALTVPNALNSGSVLADIRMYMIWATGFGDASHAGARIWLMIMNGNGTAYSAVELLGRDTDGGTGLSISRSAVNQITISSNGYGFIKSVSCMQLITN